MNYSLSYRHIGPSIIGALLGSLALGFIYGLACIWMMLPYISKHPKQLIPLFPLFFIIGIVFVAALSGAWLGACTGAALSLARQQHYYRAATCCWKAGISYILVVVLFTKPLLDPSDWLSHILVDFSVAWLWVCALIILGVAFWIRNIRSSSDNATSSD